MNSGIPMYDFYRGSIAIGKRTTPKEYGEHLKRSSGGKNGYGKKSKNKHR